jgi:hypothetical protein
MAAFGGMDYRAMLKEILRACEDRLASGAATGRKAAH